jgi:RNA polymerase primary sigma factor
MSEAEDSISTDVPYTEEPLQVYLREIGRVPALDEAEELRCLEPVRASDEMADAARRRLVEANLHRVVSLAEAHRIDSVHILDLIQAGNKDCFSR